MRFSITFAPALWVPIIIRNFFVWVQARRDAKFNWYACWDVIVRWLGKRVPWDPQGNPTHKRVEAALTLPADHARWIKEREAVEKELAKRPSFWVLVTLFVLIVAGEYFGDVQLLKSLGFEAGLRRVLLAFALCSLLISAPLVVLHFAKPQRGKRSPWLFVVILFSVLLVAVIATVQVGDMSAGTGNTSAYDIAAGLLVSFAVVGGPIIAKFVLAAFWPVWQLRKECARLNRAIKRAKRDYDQAHAYVDRFTLYQQWYDGQAAQIASVYRRAFARINLKLYKDPKALRDMMANDTPEQRDAALADPTKITHDLVRKDEHAPRTEQAQVDHPILWVVEDEPKKDDVDEPKKNEVVNPYRRQQ